MSTARTIEPTYGDGHYFLSPSTGEPIDLRGYLCERIRESEHLDLQLVDGISWRITLDVGDRHQGAALAADHAADSALNLASAVHGDSTSSVADTPKVGAAGPPRDPAAPSARTG